MIDSDDDNESKGEETNKHVTNNEDAESFTSIMKRSRESSVSSNGLSRREKPKVTCV